MASEENNDNKKSFFETVREIEEKEKREELANEARAAEEQADREAKERRSYEEQLRREKLELIKLKQGVISEEDIPKEEKIVKEYTLGERISNFFYHYKYTVAVCILAAAFVTFLVYDYVTTERPDVQGMFIATDYNMTYYADNLTAQWSSYAEDYNGDGKQIAKLYYIPAGYADEDMATMYLAQSDRTKLLGEFQSGNTIIVIGDKASYQTLGTLDGVFTDMRTLFPDDPYAEELGYRAAGTDFKTLLGYDDMNDSELYISLRNPVKTMGMSEEKMRESYDRAVNFLKAFIADHRIDAGELPPTTDPEPVEDEYYGKYTEASENG